jgi:transcription termination factor NusB
MLKYIAVSFRSTEKQMNYPGTFSQGTIKCVKDKKRSMDKARECALKALAEIETKEAYSNLVLKKNLRDDVWMPGKSFVTELVYGTVHPKLTLDW